MRYNKALLLASLLLLGSLVSCALAVPGTVGDAPPPETAVSLPADVSQEPAPRQADEPEPGPEPLLPNLDRLLETVGALCGAPRPLGGEGEYRAAQYLAGRLEEYGYQSEEEVFAYHTSGDTLTERYRQAMTLTGDAFFQAALPGEAPDGVSRNIVGRQPWERDKERVLVLSAHYDSTPDSLGVVDNAAGVAVVLEAARILASEDLPFSMRIVFFGGEEEILIGSRLHLWGMSGEERGKILGNINVDTLAYSAREEFVALSALPEAALPRRDRDSLAGASPVSAALLADSRVLPAFETQLVSDHIAFAMAGIDSVNFGQPWDEVMDLINSPADNYDLLVPEILPTAAGLLVDAVRGLAEDMEAAA